MKKLLDVRKLHVKFSTLGGSLHAVRGIDFSLNEGETLGIVGESGCGKSATAKALMQLNPRHTSELSGEILYHGHNLLAFSEKKMQSVRGKEIGMIFQDPMTSLNPTIKVGRQIMEGYLRHFPGTPTKQARKIALDTLTKVGIPHPEERFEAYPHTLSGGMRQRAMIAVALACEPKILLADEPTTALDVTIQAQILDLLKEIQKNTRTSILLITHDMSVVAKMCDRVIVMYAGQIVECASVEEIFTSPQHPYTQRLLSAIPRLNQPKDHPLVPIEGTPPNLSNPLKGCGFCARCPFAMNICAAQQPPLFEVSPNHVSACFKHDPRIKT
ncbi:MAG: ABC transporter ATP-binding protein [Verrucomicrobia bacterium]|nr:ABC transporter ATP-binding protein [Verrucomicrobiota bacterium]